MITEVVPAMPSHNDYEGRAKADITKGWTISATGSPIVLSMSNGGRGKLRPRDKSIDQRRYADSIHDNAKRSIFIKRPATLPAAMLPAYSASRSGPPAIFLPHGSIMPF